MFYFSISSHYFARFTFEIITRCNEIFTKSETSIQMHKRTHMRMIQCRYSFASHYSLFSNYFLTDASFQLCRCTAKSNEWMGEHRPYYIVKHRFSQMVRFETDGTIETIAAKRKSNIKPYYFLNILFSGRTFDSLIRHFLLNRTNRELFFLLFINIFTNKN